MDAPFGINFLRKAELYNLAVTLDKSYLESKKNKKSRHASLWPIEKAILKWTYYGHKHLGSPIKTDHLSQGSIHNKLAEFGMFNKNGKLKKDFIVLGTNLGKHKPLENIVIRGFGAYFSKSTGHNAIVINKEGLLFGETLSEMEENNWLTSSNYWVYGKIMDHPGAFALLIVTAVSLIILAETFIEKIIKYF